MKYKNNDDDDALVLSKMNQLAVGAHYICKVDIWFDQQQQKFKKKKKKVGLKN